MHDVTWFHRPRPRPAAGLRLYCFPHAGGGAAAYRAWPDLLGTEIELIAVRLPGRENRFAEHRYRRMPDVVLDLCAELRPQLRPPFAFFGHSLGALIAYETARRLGETGAPEPVHLFAAACPAPQFPTRDVALHDLPSTALIARLREFGGMPAEVLEQSDLLRAVLPTIRDDFEIAETYRPGRIGLLRCPVTAFGGRADVSVTDEDLAGWQQVTTGPFDTTVLPGDHFFLQRPGSGVMAMVESALRAHLVGTG